MLRINRPFRFFAIGAQDIGKSTFIQNIIPQQETNANSANNNNISQQTPLETPQSGPNKALRGLERNSVKMKFGSHERIMQFWDLGLSEFDKFNKSVTHITITENCDYCFVCYDITKPQTLDIAEKWISVLQNTNQTLKFFLTGLRQDLRDTATSGEADQSVSTKQGQTVATKWACQKFFECTAIGPNSNIKEIYEGVVQVAQSVHLLEKGRMEKLGYFFDDDTESNSGFKIEKTVILTDLISEKGTCLDQIFELEFRQNLMREFRNRHEHLIKFLSQKIILLELVTTLKQGKKTQQDLFSVVELLTGEVPPILDTLCLFFEEIFSFFVFHAQPTEDVHEGFYVRFANSLVHNRSVEFLKFAAERPDIFSTLVRHLRLESVGGLVHAMVQAEHDYGHYYNNHFSDKLATTLGAYANEGGAQEEDLRGLLDLIQAVSVKLPNTRFLHALLETEAFLKPVLSKAFGKGSGTPYLLILIKLISLLERSNDFLSRPETTPHPPLIRLLLGTQESDNALKTLYSALYNPSEILPPSISISTGTLSPLGSYRLQCVNLVYALLKTNYVAVDNCLVKEQILVRCTDLFFQYKWNNILHSLVEHMIVYALENKPPYLILYILREARLVERILQATQNFEQERSMKSAREQKNPHTGYMGHLWSIANHISKVSKIHASLFYFLEGFQDRSWKKFILGKLEDINQKNQQPHPPPPIGDNLITRAIGD